MLAARLAKVGGADAANADTVLLLLNLNPTLAGTEALRLRLRLGQVLSR